MENQLPLIITLQVISLGLIFGAFFGIGVWLVFVVLKTIAKLYLRFYNWLLVLNSRL